MVRQGDLLFTLDARAIEAQIAQAEGNAGPDQAQLEGAERDVRRYTDLVAKSATPIINLDNAKTQADTFQGAIKADQAALENLKVQIELLHHPRADQRAHQHGRRQGRQFRAPGRPGADRHHHSDGAGLRHASALPQRSLPESARRAGGRNVPPSKPSFRANRARQRAGHHDREYGRSDDRHGDRCGPPCRTRTNCCGPARWSPSQLTSASEEAVVVPSAAVQVSQSGNLRVRGQGRRRQGAAGQGRAHRSTARPSSRAVSMAARPSSPTDSCC